VASARPYRFVWQPRWLAGHVLVLAAAVSMVLLGRWQLTVSERKHFSLQNFGYALQWWTFSLFAVGFWLKIVHDKARGLRRSRSEQAPGSSDEPVAYRRYVMPERVGSEDDPEVAAYNAYLASLAQQDER
jgi:DNA-binding transcriptional regulator of glucitol operon